jgi:trehalose 6-phosphate synthase
MSRMARFVALLVAVLGLFTLVAYRAAVGITERWVERDLTLRTQLAVAAAKDNLLARWRAGDASGIGEALSTLALQQRVMGAAACDLQGHRFAVSRVYPTEPQLDCDAFWRLLSRPEPGAGATVDLPAGPVHVTAVDIEDESGLVGTIVVLYDVSYIGGRRGQLRTVLLIAFATLATGASLLTVFAARLAWRDWTLQLRRIVAGGAGHPEFAPLLQDVRDMVRQLASEEATENSAGAWTPERLKHTLHQHLHGERILIVANREPYSHQFEPGGGVAVVHPASGLVTALEPVMRACSGVWVAHGSGSADRETSDAVGRLAVPPGDPSYTLRRVWLTRQEEQGYYYGLANEGLWPLCHIAHTRPRFRAEDWHDYRLVNERFADAVCDEADTDTPTILVQDYHFALLPECVRRRLPRATVITFWHIPWPSAERLAMCPWHAEVLSGLLGSSIVGFHTQQHCNNFIDSVDRYLEARIDRERFAVVQGGRATLVRPYPISIEWPSHWAALTPPVAECRRYVLEQLRLPPDALIGVGVDRLDYTKGVEERFLSVERLLEREPSLVGRFTFVQLAAPSRDAIPEYRELGSRVGALVERVNERFRRPDWRAIVLRHAHHEPLEVFRYYRAADLCYVSSLHDGMNLVAKEFVAARDDEQGVLVLSQFTGAARELTEALIVNPYDLEAAAGAMAVALAMAPEEQRARMRELRSYLRHFNVYRWAGRMLLDAATLRRREHGVGAGFGGGGIGRRLLSLRPRKPEEVGVRSDSGSS